MKRISWLGSSRADIKLFPASATDDAGYQLYRVQIGIEPDDWKPLSAVGAGVREIRIWDAAGAFRVIYIAALPEAIYVLHCFQKKTQKTSMRDIEIARQRLKMILR
jgi:phage-related protein